MKPSNGKRPKTERKDYAVNGSNRRFKGVRMRKWGKWVAEVRLPNSRKRLWLGSYETPEMAARAYDAAVFCLRGPTSNFNFPDAPPVIPSAVDLTLTQIRAAAARYAHQVPVEDAPEVAGAEPVAGSVQPELQAEEKGEEAKPLVMDSAVLPESEDVFSSSLGEFSADCYFPVGRGGAGVDDILPGGAFYQSPRQWNF